jgi:acyl-CoA synthetase (NDP forming)
MVISLLNECSSKQVKIVHLFTARLSETGRPKAKKMEREIQRYAQSLGIRIIGPNCMGIYHPSKGISFGYDFPTNPGDIGVVFQSGGSATMLIQICSLQGLSFSKVVSYGNAIDIDESDILHYLNDDSNTRIIAAYFEGTRSGMKLLNTLHKVSARKPVVAIKGGRGVSGMRSVVSHTATIAGSQNLWATLFSQCNVVEVKDLNEMANMLTLFEYIPPVIGNRVGILGGGGGKCVIAADLAEEAGLVVPTIPLEMRSQLKQLVPDLWDWVGNPMDFSIWGDSAMLAAEAHRLFMESEAFDVIIVQLSDENPNVIDIWLDIIKMESDNIIKLSQNKLKPVVAVIGGVKPSYEDMQNVRWKTISQQKFKLLQARIPTFDTVSEAVSALNKYINYWRKRSLI